MAAIPLARRFFPTLRSPLFYFSFSHMKLEEPAAPYTVNPTVDPLVARAEELRLLG